MLEIRVATLGDYPIIAKILREIVSRGDSFANPVDSTDEELLNYWCSREKHVYVCSDNDKVVGTFFIKANQPGLGSHIANAGYAVAGHASGKGIGYVMGEFSLKEAKRLGFLAMQFNIVVKSNINAVKLWTKLRFEIIGEIPDAFNHISNGMTNAYVMYRKL